MGLLSLTDLPLYFAVAIKGFYHTIGNFLSNLYHSILYF